MKKVILVLIVLCCASVVYGQCLITNLVALPFQVTNAVINGLVGGVSGCNQTVVVTQPSVVQPVTYSQPTVYAHPVVYSQPVVSAQPVVYSQPVYQQTVARPVVAAQPVVVQPTYQQSVAYPQVVTRPATYTHYGCYYSRW